MIPHVKVMQVIINEHCMCRDQVAKTLCTYLRCVKGQISFSSYIRSYFINLYLISLLLSYQQQLHLFIHCIAAIYVTGFTKTVLIGIFCILNNCGSPVLQCSHARLAA